MGRFVAPAEPLPAAYAIEARLDPEHGRMSGTETIRLVNRSPLTLDTLALAADTAGCSFDVSIGGAAPSRHEADADSPALVALPEPLLPGAVVELHVTFETPIAIADRYDDWRPVGWHPKLWWGYLTQDDYEVRLDVPGGWGLAASGRRGDDGVWRSSGVKSFGLVTSPEYQAMEAQAGDTLVRCLYREAGKECAQSLVHTAVETIDYYRAEFGFYPYPFLSIVPGVRARSLGGYPVATGIVSIHQMENLTDGGRGITVHEIGHEYWGECVMDTDAPDWLWIGLGICMDRWYWRAHGSGGGRGWWYEQYLQGVRDHLDTTIERPAEQLAGLTFDHNNVVRHGKGSAVIEALATVLGQETFGRVYRKCLVTYRGKRLGAREFQRFCEAETGQDLGWFFDQWVRSNRYLAYRIASTEGSEHGGSYVTRVTVERTGTLDMPIPIEARFADGSAQRALTERLLRVQQLCFESAAPLAEVVLDPEKVLPLLSEAVGSE